MTDFIKLPANDECFTYINLDKTISFQFNKDKLEVLVLHANGNVQIKSTNLDIFEEIKKIINREMEKRMLP
ncbi:hypothetical protein [Silvanigrella sp.]|jgi:hypothetical protein|uniref:hypothetical protein n=1 Tax=Silvanigrella sp. TaxID=2024976 RepID=UPI0037CA5E14